MGDMPQGRVQSLKFHSSRGEGVPARVVPLVAQTTPEHPSRLARFWRGAFLKAVEVLDLNPSSRWEHDQVPGSLAGHPLSVMVLL